MDVRQSSDCRLIVKTNHFDPGQCNSQGNKLSFVGHSGKKIDGSRIDTRHRTQKKVRSEVTKSEEVLLRRYAMCLFVSRLSIPPLECKEQKHNETIAADWVLALPKRHNVPGTTLNGTKKRGQIT